MRTLVWMMGICPAVWVGGCDGSSGGGTPPVQFLLVAFDDAGDLYTVDTDTAAETFVLDTFFDDPTQGAIDVGRVSAATHHATNDEIWIGGGGNSACPACILVLDLATGEATFLADNSSTNRATPGIAYRGSDGAIFTTEADGSGFFSVDQVTGLTTEINPSTNSGSGNGLTFDLAETLYLAADGDLFVVDPATGSETLVAPLTLLGFPMGVDGEIVAMATRPSDGVIFALYKDGAGGGGSTTFLATLNPTTAEVTNVGQLSMTLEGLAFVPAALVS